MLKKILKIIGLLLLILFLAAGTYLYFAGPPLPANSDAIISDLLDQEPPEFVTGETGYTQNGDVRIWYEAISPAEPAKGTVLLYMGISNDALGWPPDFLARLVDAGYQVIRFDYRDTGLSDWIDDWDSQNPYTLTDLAADSIAILDALNIDQAHLVGVSMGGMVAQQTAIEHPARVLTLSSLMSSCDILDSSLPPISSQLIQDLLTISIKYSVIPTERNTIKLHLASRQLLQGETESPLEIETIGQQVLYNLRQRRGYNLQASVRHNTAVAVSGSRHPQLRTLQTPTLILHGTADPFIPLAHGQKCARTLPHAQTRYIDGMGHDIPGIFVDDVIAALLEHFT
ncbi:MAG: alpha/beta hydrolase [Chloroflexota bacterium]